MSSRKSIGSSTSNTFSGPPRCGCDLAMKMWVSSTARNLNRKFWKCRNAGNENSCELFIWDDEYGDSQKRNGNIQWDCKICDKTEKELQTVLKKLSKAKLKVEEERKTSVKLKIALVLSWVLFAFMYNLM
ncbi:uncharacterized protein LOC131618381 [Vicia villosa]|uniref:uncharacterized protein LOC131618381 n=1 Tax=Vicia villosa TaxID=3911 RepID=UPI00273C290F|nr:uncharacterized protein LOC131618381 [Vicia villosa]